MFSAFARERKTEVQIAEILNRRGMRNALGRPWNRHTVKYVLRNENYIGNSVWGRESFKLQVKRVQNAPELWLRADGAFEAIVAKSLFEAAQAIYRDRLIHPIAGRGRVYTDDEMLDSLLRLLQRRGRLTKKIINQSEGIQTASAYEGRFGRLSNAYQKIGYVPDKKRKRVRPWKRPLPSDQQMLEILRRLLHERGALSQAIIDETVSVPTATRM